MIKKILYSLLAILVVIQFFRPEKNLSDVRTNDISNKYGVPERVKTIMEGACNDCHTNKTNYPWYSNIQPVAWWLSSHVNDGKRHLNFNEFTNRRIAYQNHKFEEVIEMVKENEMPLPSYTWLGLHPAGDISDEDRNEIVKWAEAQMDTLKKQYPPDSLVMRRRAG